MLVSAILRLLPWRFFGRLGLALAEIVVATTMLAGSVILGHDLKAWRDFYADPELSKPWAPTPRPSASPFIEVRAP